MLIRSICATMTVFVATSLAGCATSPLPGAIIYCKVERPITWSKRDTDSTIAGVKAHNAVYKSVCG